MIKKYIILTSAYTSISALFSQVEGVTLIDNFSQGEVNLESGPNFDSAIRDVDPSQTIGGRRVTTIFSRAPTPSTLTVSDASTPGFVMRVPAMAQGRSQVAYGGSFQDPIFTEDFYSNGQVGFEFLFDKAPTDGFFYFAINTDFGGQYFNYTQFSGPGTYQIPYLDITEEFGTEPVDMSFASGIFWGITHDFSSTDETVYSLSEIRTYSIPEPSSLSLLVLAGFCLVRRCR